MVHWTRSWGALLSFTLVNLWIDHLAILAWFRGMPLPGHDEPHHTMVGAAMVAVLVSLLGVMFRALPWVVGAFYGAISHILLDAMVHPDMHPFEPVVMGNPLYLGAEAMFPISVLLVLPLVWLTALCVSAALGWWQRLQALRQRPPGQRSP